MRRWEHHHARSKVALLLLINLVTLLGGKYTALITIVKLELFGEAIAFAKAPKKKPAKTHLSPDQREPPPSPSAPNRSIQASQRRMRTHVVRPGDTLSHLAHMYGVSAETLQSANRLDDPDHLLCGQHLRVPAEEQLFAPPVPAESGRKDGHARWVGEQHDLEGHTPLSAKNWRSFVWPVEGLLTSPFGERDHAMGGGSAQFHAGLDVAVPSGTPVRAAQEGIVVFAGYNGAYGKVVKLDHEHGLSTLYAHNSRLVVHVGQKVKVGQVICLSGNTGRSTGPHVHFEVHKDGWPVDPLPYLR
jgi:murein DD-endopeptidase MepM/ murein hydrolase activator NlpD